MSESQADPAASSLTLSGSPVLEFVSDLHLAPELPWTVAAFVAWLQDSQADALFILGDLFEAWVGDDVLSQPFEAYCCAQLRAASRHRPVHVMRGNRDFLLGPAFFEASGCMELKDPTILRAHGQSVLLTHGDAWCVADTAYQAFRAEVRQTAWQSAFLARPLAERLALAQHMRAASQAHQAQAAGDWADVDGTVAHEHLATHGASCLLHGHTHRPQTEQRPQGWIRHVLSDWDLDLADRAEVLRWDHRGFSRHAAPAID